MFFENLFSKIELAWSDTMRWARVASILLLFSIWGGVGVLLFLATIGRLAPILLRLTNLWKFTTLVLTITAHTYYIGAKYLQDIYESPSVKHTWKYLFVVIFNAYLPKLKIVGGKTESRDDFNLVEHIGGPGILQIGRDNVVAVENLQSQKDILTAGEQRIPQFDFIKDTFSTEEQYGNIKDVTTLTADGIEITIQNIQYRFRVDGYFKRTENNFQAKEYLPSKKAITNLVYNRPVNVEGNPAVWTNAVMGLVSGVIREHVNAATLDDLIAPNDIGGHSLDALRKKFFSPAIHDKFRGMGIKLISCNIGEVAMASTDIDKERLNAWFVKQTGIVKVIRAQGRAEKFVSHERGRTEGQAMLLRSISQALQDIGIKDGDKTAIRKNLRNIVLTRTAQILEARTSVYHKRAKKEDD